MTTRALQIAFAPLSGFTPGFACPSPSLSCSAVGKAPAMVAPKDVRRKQEIERLTRQLEELRTKRGSSRGVPSANTPGQAQPTSVPSVPVPAPAPSAAEHARKGLQFGRHGEGSRFVSMTTLSEHSPRVLAMAGNLSSMSPDDLLNAPVLSSVTEEKGVFVFAKAPEGFSGQMIAVPGHDVIVTLKSPVAMLVPPEVVSSVKLPVDEGTNAVAVVERDLMPGSFSSSSFYVWGVGNEVRFGWSASEPAPDHARCLGKVVFIMIQEGAARRAAKSCWEEENEVYSA